jgi:hypothetical protein
MSKLKEATRHLQEVEDQRAGERAKGEEQASATVKGQREEGEEEKIMTSAHGQDQNDGGSFVLGHAVIKHTHGGSTQGQIFACIQKTLRK